MFPSDSVAGFMAHNMLFPFFHFQKNSKRLKIGRSFEINYSITMSKMSIENIFCLRFCFSTLSVLMKCFAKQTNNVNISMVLWREKAMPGWLFWFKTWISSVGTDQSHQSTDDFFILVFLSRINIYEVHRSVVHCVSFNDYKVSVMIHRRGKQGR